MAQLHNTICAEQPNHNSRWGEMDTPRWHVRPPYAGQHRLSERVQGKNRVFKRCCPSRQLSDRLPVSTLRRACIGSTLIIHRFTLGLFEQESAESGQKFDAEELDNCFMWE